MYAKIYSQIFDSSIAEDYEVRHVFEDLLKLCDPEGVVDMTITAISRRTNVPLEKVERGIAELMKPDPESRTPEHEGRRLLPLDERRNWGWVIVNYKDYRDLQDHDALRAYNRAAKQRQRDKEAAGLKAKVQRKPNKDKRKTCVMDGVETDVRNFEKGYIDTNGTWLRKTPSTGESQDEEVLSMTPTPAPAESSTGN